MFLLNFNAPRLHWSLNFPYLLTFLGNTHSNFHNYRPWDGQTKPVQRNPLQETPRVKISVQDECDLRHHHRGPQSPDFKRNYFLLRMVKARSQTHQLRMCTCQRDRTGSQVLNPQHGFSAVRKGMAYGRDRPHAGVGLTVILHASSVTCLDKSR